MATVKEIVHMSTDDICLTASVNDLGVYKEVECKEDTLMTDVNEEGR